MSAAAKSSLRTTEAKSVAVMAGSGAQMNGPTLGQPGDGAM